MTLPSAELSTEPLISHVRAALDALPIIAWTADAAGQLEYVNERWIELTGIPRHEAVARWATVVHPDDLASIARTYEPQRPGAWEHEYRLRMRDGTYRWHLGRSVAVTDDQGRVTRRFGTAIDVDDRKRAEIDTAVELRAQEEATRRALLLQELAVALTGATDAEAAAQIVAQLAPGVLRATSAIVWLVDLEGDLVLAARNAAPLQFVAEWSHIARSADVPAAVALRTRKPLWTDSAETYRKMSPEIAGKAEKAGRPLAFAALPLLVDERELGLVAFGFPHPHAFSGSDRSLIESLCGHLAQALERARLIDAQERALVALRVVARVGELLTASLDVKDSLQALAEAVVPSVADWCAVDLLVDDQIERLTVQHVDPQKIALAKAYASRWPERLGDGGSAAHVLATGEPVWVRRITPAMLDEAITDPERRAALAALDVRSSVQVPLVDGGRICGVVTLVCGASGREFDAGARDLILELGRRASSALTNASLYASEHRARERLMRLQRLSSALASAASSADVGGVVCVEGAAALGAATGAVYVLEGDRLRLVAQHQLAAVYVAELAEVSLDRDGPLVRAIRARQPFGVASAQAIGGEFPALAPLVRGDALSYLCIPMIGAGGDVLGALVFGFDRGQAVDEKEDVPLARTLAEQCVPAFERALALDSERRARERLAILAAAGDTFSATSDYEHTLEAVVRVTLPQLADFGFFDVIDGDGVRRTSGAHDDLEVAAILAGSTWVRSERTDVNLCALSTGKSALHPRIDDAFLRDMATSDGHLAVLRTLRLCSMITVPVVVGGTLIGALTLCHGRSGRHHTPDDLELARELARRGGVAVAQARLYRDSQEATRRAEVANKMKDEFLATVSHEIRTPLNAMLGWAQLLQGNASSDLALVRRGVEVISRNALAQKKIVDDILDVSRIIAGKLRIEPAVLDLATIAHEGLEVVRPAAAAKGVRLEHQRVGPVPMVGDAARLQQVVWNLLSNAVKFTPAGGAVTLTLVRDEDRVALRVSDTGTGIAPALLPRVFDRFVQADSSSTRTHGGLGLGLAIVRDLVALHGGTVEVTSEGVGCGATFTVELPVGIPDA